MAFLCVYVCVFLCASLLVFVSPHLGGLFRALDQSCEYVFSCEDFFRVLGKPGCTAVFSVLRMHISVSFRPVLGSEHCSCSVCVCAQLRMQLYA